MSLLAGYRKIVAETEVLLRREVLLRLLVMLVLGLGWCRQAGGTGGRPFLLWLRRGDDVGVLRGQVQFGEN